MAILPVAKVLGTVGSSFFLLGIDWRPLRREESQILVVSGMLVSPGKQSSGPDAIRAEEKICSMSARFNQMRLRENRSPCLIGT